MARDLKPKWKKNRREKYSLYDNDKWKKRMSMPGEHPMSSGRPSGYAIRFREKQKIKRIYGILEKQFKRIFGIASKSKGNTGVKLLQLLELRLDNVVYRLGIAPTRDGARQLVTHGHVTVNDKKVDIPSYLLLVNDEIYIKKTDQSKDFIKLLSEAGKKNRIPKWLKGLSFGGKVVMEPLREMLDPGINEQLVVEYYSR